MRSACLMALAAASIAPGGAELGVILPPHPQITEVLFNVPSESTGDANKDGVRHAAGDEFIELANPFDSPVNLKGYVLFNRRSSFGAPPRRVVVESERGSRSGSRRERRRGGAVRVPGCRASGARDLPRLQRL